MGVKEELSKKKAELAKIMNSKSKANCTDTQSKGSDVFREMRIEELEDEIEKLKAKGQY